MTEVTAAPAARESAVQALGGTAFYSLVGAAWAAYGVYSLHGWGRPWPAAAATFAALGLLAAILRARRVIGPQPAADVSPAEREREAWEGRVFAWVNAAQGVAIFLMVQVWVNLHRPGYIVPSIALIVGLHFFVLAPAMRARYLWATGGLLCLLVLATLLAVPQPFWRAAIGLGSGVIFWGSALYRLDSAFVLNKAFRAAAGREAGG